MKAESHDEVRCRPLYDTESTIAGADIWAQRSLLSKKSATGHLSEETFKWTWICEARSLLSSPDLPQSLIPPASSFPMLGWWACVITADVRNLGFKRKVWGWALSISWEGEISKAPSTALGLPSAVPGHCWTRAIVKVGKEQWVLWIRGSQAFCSCRRGWY